jgi:hypothetical protein
MGATAHYKSIRGKNTVKHSLMILILLLLSSFVSNHPDPRLRGVDMMPGKIRAALGQLILANPAERDEAKIIVGMSIPPIFGGISFGNNSWMVTS